MVWKKIDHPLTMETAKELVGKKIKWKTPRYRIACDGFSTERKGIAIYALPRLYEPTMCDEIAKAKATQCRSMGCGQTGRSQSARMIVRIERFHKVTREPLPPHYFTPRLTSLLEVEEIED